MPTKTATIAFRPPARPAGDVGLFEDALAELRRNEEPRRTARFAAPERSAAPFLFAVAFALLAALGAALVLRHSAAAHAEPVQAPAPGFSVDVEGAVPDAGEHGTFALATIALDDETAHAADADMQKILHDGDRLMAEAKDNARAAAAACLGRDVRAGVDAGHVIGASGGLLFALAIVDELVPGDLTAGRQVSGTGSIASDGRVGPVLEVGTKVRGAERAGADIFLVPSDQADEARRHARSIPVVGVATLGEALEALGAAGVCRASS